MPGCFLSAASGPAIASNQQPTRKSISFRHKLGRFDTQCLRDLTKDGDG